MDLDEFQKVVTLMSSKDLQKERAGLNDSIRKAKRSATLRYDEAQYAEFQTFKVKLDVVQAEITRRIEEKKS